MIDPITQAVRDALPAPLLSQAQCHRVAVAVLRAVREPTPRMCGRAVLPSAVRVASDNSVGVTHVGADYRAIYRAMIDTLISELEKEPAE